MWHRDLRYVGQPVLGRFVQGFFRPPGEQLFRRLDPYYDRLGEVEKIDFRSIGVTIRLFADTFPVPFFYVYDKYFSVLKRILGNSEYADRVPHMEKMIRRSLDEIMEYKHFPVFFYGHMNEYQNVIFPTYPVYFRPDYNNPVDLLFIDMLGVESKLLDLVGPFLDTFRSYVSGQKILLLGPRDFINRVLNGSVNWALLNYMAIVFFVDYMRYVQRKVTEKMLFFPFFYTDYRLFEYTVQYPMIDIVFENGVQYKREASIRSSYPFYHMFQYYGAATIHDYENLFRYYNYTTGYLGTLSFMHPMFIPMARRLARDVLLWNISRGVIGDIINENPMRQVNVGEYNVFFNPFFTDAFIYYDEDGVVKSMKTEIDKYDSAPVTVTSMMIVSDAFRRVIADYNELLKKAEEMENNERFQNYFRNRTGQDFIAAEVELDRSVVDDLLKNI